MPDIPPREDIIDEFDTMYGKTREDRLQKETVMQRIHQKGPLSIAEATSVDGLLSMSSDSILLRCLSDQIGIDTTGPIKLSSIRDKIRSTEGSDLAIHVEDARDAVLNMLRDDHRNGSIQSADLLFHRLEAHTKDMPSDYRREVEDLVIDSGEFERWRIDTIPAYMATMKEKREEEFRSIRHRDQEAASIQIVKSWRASRVLSHLFLRPGDHVRVAVSELDIEVSKRLRDEDIDITRKFLLATDTSTSQIRTAFIPDCSSSAWVCGPRARMQLKNASTSSRRMAVWYTRQVFRVEKVIDSDRMGQRYLLDVMTRQYSSTLSDEDIYTGVGLAYVLLAMSPSHEYVVLAPWSKSKRIFGRSALQYIPSDQYTIDATHTDHEDRGVTFGLSGNLAAWDKCSTSPASSRI